MISLYNIDFDDDLILWHYLDVKYLKDIVDGSLYLRQTKQFEADDPNECRSTFGGKILGKIVLNLGIRSASKCSKIAIINNLSIENINEILGDKRRQEEYYVKCFHMSEKESATMWGNYANKNGVVIKTSFRRLQKALQPSKNLDLSIGKVIYSKDSIQSIFTETDSEKDAVMTKDRRFQHEKELRLALHSSVDIIAEENDGVVYFSINNKGGQGGIKIRINPYELIEEIIIAPGIKEFDMGEEGTVECISYVRKLLKSSKYFVASKYPSIIYSQLEGVEMGCDGSVVSEGFKDRQHKNVNDSLFNKILEEAILSDEVINLLADGIKKNLVGPKDEIVYQPYDPSTGKISSAYITKKAAEEGENPYIEITMEEQRKILDIDGWWEKVKVNPKTKKLVFPTGE